MIGDYENLKTRLPGAGDSIAAAADPQALQELASR
jgi:hypothetical protein